MSELDNMSEVLDSTDEDLDLGSAPSGEDFDPFATDDDLGDEPAAEPLKAPVSAGNPTAKPEADSTEAASGNPLESAITTAENKEAEKSQQNLFEKLPVFEYAGAAENIEDASKTFEELRIEKAADFPELDDGKRVSWTVEYGKITKTVADPKAASIGKMKSDIETSKEFLDSLKKAKDKNPACKIKPRVTAQSKGTASAYKAVFTNMDDAKAAGKVISIVPARDGKVYEIRNTEMGKFITPVTGCELLSDVRAGFIPALPLIPADLMMRIISFFRYFMGNGNEHEVLVNIYWDKQNREFIVDAPEQTVTKVSVESNENLDFAHDRYIHYMDIHSHNSMKAFFSAIDDADEKATRLYTVIGNLHEYFPDVKTRISNGGKFLEIDPAEVFELAAKPFPSEWKNNVHFRAPHDNDTDSAADVPWHTNGTDDL